MQKSNIWHKEVSFPTDILPSDNDADISRLAHNKNVYIKIPLVGIVGLSYKQTK